MILAHYNGPYGGYNSDKETALKYLEEGKTYEVSYIDMGQSHTSIHLKDFQSIGFNSIYFRFYEDDEPLDIFNDARFNPYLNL